jgi:hypothetical protein
VSPPDGHAPPLPASALDAMAAARDRSQGRGAGPSPLPWRVARRAHAVGCDVLDAAGRTIAVGVRRADAEALVAAVNAGAAS